MPRYTPKWPEYSQKYARIWPNMYYWDPSGTSWDPLSTVGTVAGTGGQGDGERGGADGWQGGRAVWPNMLKYGRIWPKHHKY